MNYDPWHLSGQVIRYGYDAKGPAGANNSVILMGQRPDAGLSDPVAGHHRRHQPGARRRRALGAGEKLRFYNDYSVLWKDRHGGSDSKMNTLGYKYSPCR